MASDVEKLGDLMMTDLPESCRSEVNTLRKRLSNDEEGWRALCVVMLDLARLTQPAASGEQPSEDTARDAARYRWLLAKGKPAAEGLLMRDPSKWSAAIDSAIKGEK